VPYTAEKDGPVYFCACKHGSNGVLCDGTHKSLPRESAPTTESPETPA
jgi:CDGSH-type Zn-finger protein